jgi:hypothetical protein
MAEQNRKTNAEKALREEAQQIVDDFIDYQIVVDLQDDIANEGRHILGTYADHGSLPKGSGFSGFCTLASRVDRIRRQELTGRMIEASKVMGRLSKDLQLAACIDKGLRGKTRTVAQDPLNEKYVEITFSIPWCAGVIGVDPATYRKRVSRAYQQIERVLQSYSQAA